MKNFLIAAVEAANQGQNHLSEGPIKHMALRNWTGQMPK